MTSRPMIGRCAAIAFGTALLGACTSAAPTHYHSLLDRPDTVAPATAPAAFLIDVQPVGIPAQVDRPQIVVRDADGMVPLERERWIAPLADEIRTTLSAGLTRELATTDVAGQPRPVGARVLNIRVDLRRFESAPGAYAAVDATWSLSLDIAKSSPLVCSIRVRESAGEGYEALVRAHRLVLATIARRIATAARAYASAGDGTCAPD